MRQDAPANQSAMNGQHDGSHRSSSNNVGAAGLGATVPGLSGDNEVAVEENHDGEISVLV